MRRAGTVLLSCPPRIRCRSPRPRYQTGAPRTRRSRPDGLDPRPGSGDRRPPRRASPPSGIRRPSPPTHPARPAYAPRASSRPPPRCFAGDSLPTASANCSLAVSQRCSDGLCNCCSRDARWSRNATKTSMSRLPSPARSAPVAGSPGPPSSPERSRSRSACCSTNAWRRWLHCSTVPLARASRAKLTHWAPGTSLYAWLPVEPRK